MQNSMQAVVCFLFFIFSAVYKCSTAPDPHGFEEEICSRNENLNDIWTGFKRFIVGLAKKVILANNTALICDAIYQGNISAAGTAGLWLAALAYTMQIYFDFSGYSDMAIGLGRIFGFRFHENFNYPYISKSITEFWRRWHMSLGSWFRDYVYIPMGGNRVNTPRWLFNIFVVWMLTGFWHGADWNFILWGVYFGIFLILEKLWLGKIIAKLPSFVSRIYVLFLVLISFVIFNGTGMNGVFSDIVGLFGGGNIPVISDETLYHLRSYGILLVLGVIGATPLVKNTCIRLLNNEKTRSVVHCLETPIMLVLLVLITAYLVDGSFNPFLYFRF